MSKTKGRDVLFLRVLAALTVILGFTMTVKFASAAAESGSLAVWFLTALCALATVIWSLLFAFTATAAEERDELERL